jgi:hypothetical protein
VGDDTRSRSALEQAVHWLTLDRNLANQTEQIRRFITEDHWESLTARLFTAAWVAKALLAADACGIAGTESLLNEAAKRIVRAQRDGVWEWDGDEQPVWMSYQGMSALQACALHNWSLP